MSENQRGKRTRSNDSDDEATNQSIISCRDVKNSVGVSATTTTSATTGGVGFIIDSSKKDDNKNDDESVKTRELYSASDAELAALVFGVDGAAKKHDRLEASSGVVTTTMAEDEDEEEEDFMGALMAFAGTAAETQSSKQKHELAKVTSEADKAVQALLLLSSASTDDDQQVTTAAGAAVINSEINSSSSRALAIVHSGDPIDSDDEALMETLQKQDNAYKKKVAANDPDAKTKHLKTIDHETFPYEPPVGELKTDFFIPPSEARNLSEEEVKQLRFELDGAKCFGRQPPPPIRTWEGIGLSEDAMNRLLAKKFPAPFAIQALAIPVLMSGRNLVAIAKTGSGKTLAYLLPLLRHCEHQFREVQKRRVAGSKGPLGLVLVPTRELADQIFQVCKDFCSGTGSGVKYSSRDGRPESMRLATSYGGTSVQENIAHCKAGCEVMVATPARLVDMLAANHGTAMSLGRCSFVVVDEADRMFDEGFCPHVSYFLKSTRPDRVVAMVSGSMPREIRALIKQHISDPIEISCGDKATPSSNVTQYVELFDDCTGPANQNPRWMRLMQLLGDQDVEERLVLIFMGKDRDCDYAMAELTKMGYDGKVAVLYSKMAQIDREMSLARFNKKDRPILIATGVAERGLDVPDLNLVINYAVPDHLEAYIHRVGRTGRAGRRGTAYTFMTRGIDNYMAADLAKALDQSGNDVSEELQLLARGETMQKKENKKRNQEGALMIIQNPGGGGGEHFGGGGGDGGTGSGGARSNLYRGFRGKNSYKFNAADRADGKKVAGGGGNNNNDDGEEGEDDDRSFAGEDGRNGAGVRKAAGGRKIEHIKPAFEDSSSTALVLVGNNALVDPTQTMTDRQQLGLSAAQKFADRLTKNANADEKDETSVCQTEFEINDLPQKIRSRVVQSRSDIESKVVGASIVVKGVWVDEKARNSLLGRTGAATSLKPGERKMYLQVRGKTEATVAEAINQIEACIVEENEKIMRRESNFGVSLPGR